MCVTRVYVMSKTRVDLLRQGVCVCAFMWKTRVDLQCVCLRQGVCVCVYVKDTSRSTETGSVCVCVSERHE